MNYACSLLFQRMNELTLPPLFRAPLIALPPTFRAPLTTFPPTLRAPFTTFCAGFVMCGCGRLGKRGLLLGFGFVLRGAGFGFRLGSVGLEICGTGMCLGSDGCG